MRRGFSRFGTSTSRPPYRGRPHRGMGPVRSIASKSRNQHVAKVTKRFQFGQHEVDLETGEIARQAGGAGMASCEATMVLCTAVAAITAREGRDCIPLA